MIDDLFLQNLIKDIYKWYDKWYLPGKVYYKYEKAAKFVLDGAKREHIQILLEYYDKARFDNCNDLTLERDKFLGEIQQIVDNLRGV